MRSAEAEEEGAEGRGDGDGAPLAEAAQRAVPKPGWLAYGAVAGLALALAATHGAILLAATALAPAPAAV